MFYYWQNEHFFLKNEGSFSFGKNSFIQRISITIKYLWAVLFQFPIDFELICFNWEQSFTFPNLYCKNSTEYVTIVSFQACTQTSMQCTLYNLHFMDGDHGELAGIACFVLQEKILFWPCNKSFINCPSLFGQDGWMYIGLIFFKWTFTSSQFSVWGILCVFSKCSQCSWQTEYYFQKLHAFCAEIWISFHFTLTLRLKFPIARTCAQILWFKFSNFLFPTKFSLKRLFPPSTSNQLLLLKQHLHRRGIF